MRVPRDPRGGGVDPRHDSLWACGDACARKIWPTSATQISAIRTSSRNRRGSAPMSNGNNSVGQIESEAVPACLPERRTSSPATAQQQHKFLRRSYFEREVTDTSARFTFSSCGTRKTDSSGSLQNLLLRSWNRPAPKWDARAALSASKSLAIYTNWGSAVRVFFNEAWVRRAEPHASGVLVHRCRRQVS